MTAQKMAKSAVAGVAAQTFDVTTELGGREYLEYVLVTNRSANEIAVNGVGGTASIGGDDCIHIPTGASRPIPFPTGGTLSYIASGATSNVEFASDRHGPLFFR